MPEREMTDKWEMTEAIHCVSDEGEKRRENVW